MNWIAPDYKARHVLVDANLNQGTGRFSAGFTHCPSSHSHRGFSPVEGLPTF